MKRFFKIARLLLFIILSGLLIHIGHWPNTWEFWSIVACAGLISITEYFGKDK